jgi:hypothetical protein
MTVCRFGSRSVHLFGRRSGVDFADEIVRAILRVEEDLGGLDNGYYRINS